MRSGGATGSRRAAVSGVYEELRDATLVADTIPPGRGCQIVARSGA